MGPVLSLLISSDLKICCQRDQFPPLLFATVSVCVGVCPTELFI